MSLSWRELERASPAKVRDLLSRYFHDEDALEKWIETHEDLLKENDTVWPVVVERWAWLSRQQFPYPIRELVEEHPEKVPMHLALWTVSPQRLAEVHGYDRNVFYDNLTDLLINARGQVPGLLEAFGVSIEEALTEKPLRTDALEAPEWDTLAVERSKGESVFVDIKSDTYPLVGFAKLAGKYPVAAFINESAVVVVPLKGDVPGRGPDFERDRFYVTETEDKYASDERYVVRATVHGLKTDPPLSGYFKLKSVLPPTIEDILRADRVPPNVTQLATAKYRFRDAEEAVRVLWRFRLPVRGATVTAKRYVVRPVPSRVTLDSRGLWKNAHFGDAFTVMERVGEQMFNVFPLVVRKDGSVINVEDGGARTPIPEHALKELLFPSKGRKMYKVPCLVSKSFFV